YDYLEEFNKSRNPIDPRYKLILKYYNGGSVRLESVIVDDIKMDYSKADVKVEEFDQTGTIEQTSEILKALQKEMTEFSEFLKQKFFENSTALKN
ncbi:MAG: hypothetical protein Q8P54_02255, partial [bacterium]|nr:hypothetical protein [bacterium]